ncbi:class I adenylate-forming enzyme family protein [Amycolatopsis pithecellobii]|uniref:AMP-binding protein n=1 Tax=Amycolatopsis pithecellobii TaxID=664692 RepID=A0A6N7YPK4_9PSEU|nr:AMP-binding protein [Amycolatopsis pithecellobii]MTD53818.1 AMP-binding protein [Amycolatopsis pithecellobii]
MFVPLTIRDYIDRAATVFPDRIAVVDEPDAVGAWGSITYRELDARARGMAVAFDAMNVGPGERVAIISPNAAKFLTSFFGVSGYGRVLVPVNYRLTADEIGYILEHSGASVVLVDPEIDVNVGAVAAKHRIVLDGIADQDLFTPAAPDQPPLEWDVDENAMVSINYTSGTTARPKGVRLTHRGSWLNAAVFGWSAGVTDRDVLLHTLPMFHCNGWGMPYALTGMGGKHIVIRKIDGEDILERVDREGVTLMCAAPAVLAAILDAAAARRSRGEQVPGFGSVRVVGAGAPPPSKTIERVQGELGWEFIQIYGLTETSPLLTMNRAIAEWDGLESHEKASRLSKAGTPALGVRIKTDDEGEVLARSNHVFDGYWNQPEETAKALVDGWFHTGDGGSVGSENYLTITDRKKDVIITGGENVSSIEVEDCIYQHPDVAEAAVIGIPDPKWGETILALVVPRRGAELTEADLIAFCRERMSHFKCPTAVEFRENLVRTATGKLQKFKLRQPYWNGHEKTVSGG